MKRKIKDGFHRVYDFSVYVENSRVIYAIVDGKRLYPYEDVSKNKKFNGVSYNKICPTLPCFRKGISEERFILC